MDKSACIRASVDRLTAMGLAYVLNDGADVTLSCEFLDASWGTGKKTIHYEASVLFDEANQTVLMWEMTKETGSGLSFGSANESSFQTGKTLFRKVKSVQYGPDGLAYDVNLDLGAIPKAFKETALQYGWKFKTVLSRSKASYGTMGTSAVQPIAPVFAEMKAAQSFCVHCGSALKESALFCAACGAPKPEAPHSATVALEQQKQHQVKMGQKGSPAKNKAKFGALNGFIFGFMSVVTLVFFGLGGTTVLGKVLAGVILVGAYGVMKSLKHLKAVPKLLIWSGIFILLVIVFALTIQATATEPFQKIYKADELSLAIPIGVLDEGAVVSVVKDNALTITPAIEGANVVAYDISLPAGTDLEERVVEIQMPFDKSLLPEGEAEDAIVGAVYYDEGLALWIPQTCRVDFEKGIVTVYTDHFSKYAVVIFKDGRKKLTATIPEFEYPNWNYSDSEIEAMVAEGSRGETQSATALEKGWNQFNKLYGLTGATSGVIEAVAGGETLSNVNKLMNEVGMGFALSQLAFDLYKGDTTAAKINFTKSSAFYAISKWGGSALGLASSGVTFIDMALNEFGETAINKNLEKWETAYREYYRTEPTARRSEGDWYKRIVSHYKASSDSADFNKRLEADVDAYADLFWKDANSAFKVADRTDGKAGFGLGGEYANGVPDISKNFKAFLYQTTIKNQVTAMAQRQWFLVNQQAERKYDVFKKEMNKVHTVKVSIQSFGNVKNPNLATFKLINAKGIVVHSQGFDGSGTSGVSMSLLGFLKAGGPLKAVVSVPAYENMPAFSAEIPFMLTSSEVSLSTIYPYTYLADQAPQVQATSTTEAQVQEVATQVQATEATTQAPTQAATEAPAPPAKVFDEQAALAAWAADFAAEINSRVYDNGICISTSEFEWVVAPYIKDGTVLGASKIWQTNAFYAGDYSGQSFRGVSNESYDATNHGPYISLSDLMDKYPIYK